MKQGKRKSNRRLVSKEMIRQASYAKSKGLLSKKAKTTGGKLSRNVAKKVEALARAEAVPTYELRPGAKRATIVSLPKRIPMKLNPQQLAKAKKAGIFTTGNKVIIPREGEYREAIEEGLVAGYGTEGETIYEADRILLASNGIHNYRDLKAALESGKWDKYLDREDRLFAFTIYGYHPRGDRVFFTGEDLAKYLERYQFDDNEEAFDNFELLTLPMGDTLGPTPPSVRAMNIARLKGKAGRREGLKRKAKRIKAERASKSKAELEEMNRIRVARWREKQRQLLGEKRYKANEARERAKRRKAK